MIQIFDRNGQFIRRFGNDLESPRAICIDQQGRIIVIESKIMKGIYRISLKCNSFIFLSIQFISMTLHPVVFGVNATFEIT